MKWMSKRFTFVVIPDANQSVQRYSVSGLIIVLIPALIILLAICSALFIVLFSGQASNLKEVKHQLSLSESGYEEQLKDREDTIAALEADVTALSAQAKHVETKMSEIAELELQLKEIAGIQESEVRISSGGITVEEGGQGGEELLLPEELNDALAAETLQELSSMALQMDEMKPSLEATKEALLKHQRILEITPTIWPADSRKITSTFGVRRDPFTGRAAVHSGLDLGGSRGDPIYAAADGVVTLSERTYPHGNNILIDHGRGIETRYLHLNKRLVEVGAKVKKGDLIGELGNTGRSTGPHLHYEVIVGGEHVDPMPYLQEDREEK